MVIDHHASNEGYGDVNYTKISEACAENVYYILDSAKLKNTVDCEANLTAADYIYMGILHDTGCFIRAKGDHSGCLIPLSTYNLKRLYKRMILFFISLKYEIETFICLN